MLDLDRVRFTRYSITVGILAWTLVLAAVASGRAPFGIIELFFLFAPLVVVPLGVDLGEAYAPMSPRIAQLSRLLQPSAAMLLVAAFWRPPGFGAALFAMPWATFCVLLALGALPRLRRSTVPIFAVTVARLDLALAAAWLLLSRSGQHLTSFQEPIVLLTAVHFHHTGFATASIAGGLAEYVRRQGRSSRLISFLVLFAVILPFVLAAGFVFSPSIKVCAAILLAVCIPSLAVAQLFVSRKSKNPIPIVFFSLSMLASFASMFLAAVYAIGEFRNTDWLSIPRMASMHGALNALGFVLPALAGWLVALGLETKHVLGSDSARSSHIIC